MTSFVRLAAKDFESIAALRHPAGALQPQPGGR